MQMAKLIGSRRRKAKALLRIVNQKMQIEAEMMKRIEENRKIGRSKWEEETLFCALKYQINIKLIIYYYFVVVLLLHFVEDFDGIFRRIIDEMFQF